MTQDGGKGHTAILTLLACVCAGLFVPTQRRDLTSLTWWINFFNWWGGVGFFMSGVFLYYYPVLDAQTYQIENAFGFGVGSLCFLVGGLLLFVQMSLRKEGAPRLLQSTAEMSSTLGSEASHGSVRGGSPTRLTDGSANGILKGGSPLAHWQPRIVWQPEGELGHSIA